MTTNLADISLIDLFRMEAENQIRALEDGLVLLERDQRPERVEPLMRAAHSLKGAARIVGLDQAVGLAHAMEDVLQAAQSGTRHLAAADIDLLLRGVDQFKQMSQLPSSEIPDWLAQHASALEELRAQVASAPAPAPAAVPAPAAAPAPGEASDAKPVPARQESTKDGMVRVSSETLSRLLGLAGESLVEARALLPFNQTLRQLKSCQSDARAALEAGDCESAQVLLAQTETMLVQHAAAFDLFSQRLENIADRLYQEVIQSRMRPFADGVQGFSRMVRDQAKACGKDVEFEIGGMNTPVDRDIMERLEAPLTHLLRNAVDHGLEPAAQRIAAGKPPRGTLILEAAHSAGMLAITVRDDGRGIDVEKLRAKAAAQGCVSADMAGRLTRAELFEFLFLPGFSTAERVTEYSGRGVGLDVVQDMVQAVHGTVRVESETGAGTTFTLQLPLTLSVQKTLLTQIGGEMYAFPLARVDRVEKLAPERVQVLEGRQFFQLEEHCIGVIAASEVLQLPSGESGDGALCVVVVSDRVNRYGVIVERFLGEKELVVKPLDPRLGKVPDVSAAAVLDDRMPVLIIDVDDLVRSVDRLLGEGALRSVHEGPQADELQRKRVLIVDDSLTVREVERRLLEGRGYEVEVAVDGMDGWNAIRSRRFDIVISDIDMPRLNGIELVRRIKADPQLKEIPVMIVSYKDRDEDRLLGLEAGANYYLTKSSFHDESLINAVVDLVGEP